MNTPEFFHDSPTDLWIFPWNQIESFLLFFGNPTPPFLCYGPREHLAKALDLGAIDYSTPPLNWIEILDRACGRTRHTRIDGSSKPIFWCFPNIKSGEKTIPLGALEAKVFSLLIETPSAPISKEHLARTLDLKNPEGRSIDVLVSRIRQKLMKGLNLKEKENPILSFRGLGYMLRL